MGSSRSVAKLQSNGWKTVLYRGRPWNPKNWERPRLWLSLDIRGRQRKVLEPDLHAGGQGFESQRLHHTRA